MPEIPKLSPEVELPRPRSSGVAVVAVAALAMFTAVGASAFIVRVRMGMAPCAMHRSSPASVLDRAAAARLDLLEAFVSAVGDHDDQTALELYQQVPVDLDPSGRLRHLHDSVVERQMALLQDEVARGACDEVRRHVSWLRHAAPDENITVNMNQSECTDQKRYIRVELAP